MKQLLLILAIIGTVLVAALLLPPLQSRQVHHGVRDVRGVNSPPPVSITVSTNATPVQQGQPQ